MKDDYQILNELQAGAAALRTAQTALDWGLQTDAPVQSAEATGKAMGLLAAEEMRLLVNDRVGACLSALAETPRIDPVEQAVIKEWNRIYRDMKSVPPEIVGEYAELCGVAQAVWEQAKAHSNYERFAPYLEKLISLQIRITQYRDTQGKSTYDALLNDYEEGYTTERLDSFFDELKCMLIPLCKKAAERHRQIDKSYNCRTYPAEKQRAFCTYLAAYAGFDFERGMLRESVHPFTTQLHNQDVRITTHYDENNLESAIFSVIHETGHANYEFGVRNALNFTILAGGSTMGLHESQSRLYENMIGRSRMFWIPVFPKLKETFPEQLADVSLNHFLRGINKTEPGLIRTEADELTYPLHIIIRYEIEKKIFAGQLPVREIPAEWNRLYQEYLGITPPNDAMGVLQDVHWAGGSFGYFPSYALGSAAAAQIFYHLAQVMPLDMYLKEGNLKPIQAYLTTHIYQYGKMKRLDQALADMTGEPLNPQYYMHYLQEKYA